MNPRALWERWQREGRPTAGSRKPLPEFLRSHAQWHAAGAFTAEARGQPIHPTDVAELHATVTDLTALLRERGIPLESP